MSNKKKISRFEQKPIGALSGAWSDFFTPLLILDKNSVVPLEIYRMKSDSTVQMNTYFMALVFSSIPPFLIFAIFQSISWEVLM